MKIVIAFIFPLVSWAAGMKAVSSSLHGERMVVEQQVLNSGRSVLVVEEIMGDKKREMRQTVELHLRKGEMVSLGANYRCLVDKVFVYAVISERRATKNGVFAPERAWSIDEEAIRLIPVTDPKTVQCQWFPEAN